MAGITQILGSSIAHVTTQLGKGITDVYEDIDVKVSGSSSTGSIQQIQLTLVSLGYGIPTDVIMATGGSLSQAQTRIAGSYSNTSAIYRVSLDSVETQIAAQGSQYSGSFGESIIVALVKKQGPY